MPYSPRCRSCSHEDCCCCEVWIEEQADARASMERDPDDEFADYDMDYDPDEEDEESFDDSMDGDFDTGMRDAGFGTSEDYGDYGQFDCDDY
jgi:hypothetical protein